MERWLKRTSRMMVLLMFLGTSVAPMSQDAGGPYQRMRLVSLQTLLSSKQTLVQRKWKEFNRLNRKMEDLIASDVEILSQNPEKRTADEAVQLSVNAEERVANGKKRKELLVDLVDLYHEMDSIQDEIDKLRDAMRSNQQLLNGKWILTMMPSGVTGEVFLNQEGTLVTGEYHLSNGQHGSLKGTFIKRILFLERIDSQYGKMGRFEGTLMSGDRSVHGSWYSYNFSSGKPITGPFKLVRGSAEAGS